MDTGEEKQDWRRWFLPYSSGWPWRQMKKEKQKKGKDLIWIRFGFNLDEIGDFKNNFFQGMSSLSLKWEPFF